MKIGNTALYLPCIPIVAQKSFNLAVESLMIYK